MAVADPAVDVGGISVVAGGAGADGTVPGVLAFTGTGPGTLPLAIVGMSCLVVGAVATVFGRKRPRRTAHANGLADLSHLADAPFAAYAPLDYPI